MNNLFIIIKKEYLDQIIAGTKIEEYRLVTPYWVKKLAGRNYDKIIFQAGYHKTSMRHEVKYLGYEVKNIKHEFFGNEDVSVFAIKLI
jgi:hypothetical protein